MLALLGLAPSLLLLLLPLLSAGVHAFNFTTPLVQCSNITMTWGIGGQAPYEILLVPIGHLTPEIRTIINYQNITPTPSSSSGSYSYSFSFPLTFPAGSQFVAVLSDSQYGPGSGGTSSILTVLPSSTNDTSCLGTSQVKPAFYFYLDPATPSQCSDWQISWPQSIASLSPNKDEGISLWAIVPGQATFAVPLPDPAELENNSTNSGELECSYWNVDLAEGTDVMLVAGYEPGTVLTNSTTGTKSTVLNGRGKGGSTNILTVGSGSSGSCLTSDPPATTLFPTSPSTSTGSTSPSGTSHPKSSTQTPIGATSGGGNGAAPVGARAISVTGMMAVAGLVVFFGTVGGLL